MIQEHDFTYVQVALKNKLFSMGTLASCNSVTHQTFAICIIALYKELNHFETCQREVEITAARDVDFMRFVCNIQGIQEKKVKASYLVSNFLELKEL
jgi:hypothetical protein